MDVIESLKWRYATKKFNPDQIIPESEIDTLCDAFNLTATSYGLQPIKLFVIKDKELQVQLQSASMNQPQVGSASHVLVICIENTVDADFIENYFKLFPNKNEDLLAYKDVLKGRFSSKTMGDIKQWAVKQAYIALGNLMTVCAYMKIDSCPMEGFIPNKVDDILDLKEKGASSILLLPIGYRSEDDFNANNKKVRRPINEITSKIY